MLNKHLPYISRKATRQVLRYMNKHPKFTFTEAYNKLHNTNYYLNQEDTSDLSNNK